MVRYLSIGRLAFWLLVLLCAACSRTPPEQRLRQQVQQMNEAIEQRRPSAFIEAVAADFVGNHGLDRGGLERLLKAQVLLNQQLGATLGPVSVDLLADGTARVRVDVVLRGGSGRLLPERASVLAIDSHWRQVDGQWQVYRAQWQQIGH